MTERALIESEVEALLYRVWVDLGVCLTPDSYDHLVTNAPNSIDGMTDAIFAAEGIDAAKADSRLKSRVREYVVAAFAPVDPRDDSI
jgi:hypothetical protein